MNKRTSPAARVLAVIALVIALIAVIVAVGGSLGGGGDSTGSSGHKHAGKAHKAKPKRIPATYEVKSGDTLISIAHQTGVPVREIEALNPEVDPQILVAGEQLKLR